MKCDQKRHCTHPCENWNLAGKTGSEDVLGWPKSSFGFSVKIKDTFFIFTKNFIEQLIHGFVPLPSAIFQATS